MKYLPWLLLSCMLLGGCSPDLTCNMIHEPKGGCPQGYVREKEPRFTEKDGSQQYACVSSDPTKEKCVDTLRAGESVGFHPEEGNLP